MLGLYPFPERNKTRQNFSRALGWFQHAGLEQVKAQSFIHDVQAPLNSGERTALTSLLEMLWGEPQSEVMPEDWNEYQRLCTPGSADFILDIPDYYAFFTYSLFRGKVVEK